MVSASNSGRVATSLELAVAGYLSRPVPPLILPWVATGTRKTARSDPSALAFQGDRFPRPLLGDTEMAKVVTPITATVEYITAIKDGQYGPYQSVLFKTQDGEKIWKSFDPDSEELAILSKGTRVQLILAGERNGKPSHQIVLLDSPMIAPTIPNSLPALPSDQPVAVEVGWSPEQKRAIAAKVSQHADLLAYCLQVSHQKFAQTGLVESEESVRTLATTLFIQALK